MKCTLTDLPEWQALAKHQQNIANQHMRHWFTEDKNRFALFNLQFDEILLDYSRNRIQKETLNHFCNLAKSCNLAKKIDALFNGYPVNTTEKRPALHTALRDKNHTAIFVNGENIALQITACQEKMQDFVTQIHSQRWRGLTGKPISNIVNIGIGGSYIGPMMCSHALKDFAQTNLKLHFISSVDKVPLNEILQQVDPETTLFIISSKSFTTLETLTNARTIMTWMQTRLGKNVFQQHFIAVTADRGKAIAFGIPEENIFPLWDWVGGRYSIWSAIGLPLMLMIGNEHFSAFLEGAFQIDQHFRYAEFTKNMPIIMAMLGIWYMNFFDAKNQAIIPYAHRLHHFIPYLQQMEMESNGKRTKTNGDDLYYPTGSVIFGEEGCKGQHAYHQLLHQGQHLIPVDFILVGHVPNANDAHQAILIASALSQAQALMRGKTYEEAFQELITANHLQNDDTKHLAHHRVIPGNKPSNVLFLDRVTPKNLGTLIALYEHKIFVQGVIWEINSFDQWGVELGKQLLPTILQRVQGDNQLDQVDSATAGLIEHFKKIQGYGKCSD